MNHLIAGKGYDIDAMVAKAEQQGAQAMIPSRKNRLQQRPYDKALYKLRHLLENAFLHLNSMTTLSSKNQTGQISTRCQLGHIKNHAQVQVRERRRIV